MLGFSNFTDMVHEQLPRLLLARYYEGADSGVAIALPVRGHTGGLPLL